VHVACIKRASNYAVVDVLPETVINFLVSEGLKNISSRLTLNLLTTTIVVPPSNASKWQVGFNSAFKGLNLFQQRRRGMSYFQFV
jgi:hypothetical protein